MSRVGCSGCEDMVTDFPELDERRRCCKEDVEDEVDDGAAIKEDVVPPARC